MCAVSQANYQPITRLKLFLIIICQVFASRSHSPANAEIAAATVVNI